VRLGAIMWGVLLGAILGIAVSSQSWQLLIAFFVAFAIVVGGALALGARE
jgi:hypothetical protein